MKSVYIYTQYSVTWWQLFWSLLNRHEEEIHNTDKHASKETQTWNMHTYIHNTLYVKATHLMTSESQRWRDRQYRPCINRDTHMECVYIHTQYSVIEGDPCNDFWVATKKRNTIQTMHQKRRTHEISIDTYTILCYRVAKTQRMPYLYMSFSANEPYNQGLFCGKRPAA
jgi:hypothetical protein